MTLAAQMVTDATTVCANTTEHAVAIRVMDGGGEITNNVPVILDHKISDVEKVPYGRSKVQRCQLGIPSTYAVDDDWKFELSDGDWWAVARDEAASIADDSAGWLWVTITNNPIHDRGDPDYNGRV